MPTPFMHMALAHRLMGDASFPENHKALLQAAWGPFLLGSIAPDARVSSGISRVDTHFFDYTPVIDPPPVVTMLARHPYLKREHLENSDQLAFVAGYVAHLAMDEVWSANLLYPAFIADSAWAPKATR